MNIRTILSSIALTVAITLGLALPVSAAETYTIDSDGRHYYAGFQISQQFGGVEAVTPMVDRADRGHATGVGPGVRRCAFDAAVFGGDGAAAGDGDKRRQR